MKSPSKLFLGLACVLFAHIGISQAATSDWYENQSVRTHVNQSVQMLVGDTIGSYFSPPNLSAMSNINNAIYAVPEPVVDIGNGLHLLSGHVQRNDHQQAILVVNDDYDVLYAGLFHRDCRLKEHISPKLAEFLETHPEYLQKHPESKPVSCHKGYVLTVFTKTTIPDVVDAALQRWLDTQFAQDKARIEVIVPGKPTLSGSY